jgi:HK97 family phage major capsid protein
MELKELQALWQQKHDEANAILAMDNPTGEQLTKAEKLFDERDQIGNQIADWVAGSERLGKLKGRAAEGKKWGEQPASPLMPFSAKGHDGAREGFKVEGWEPAGHTTLDRYARHVVEEVGPGTFGEKAWEAMQSFEYRKDFARFIRKGNRILDTSHKTLQVGLDDQGGVLAPAELLMRVVGRSPAPTSLRGRCQQFTTGRDALVMPRKQYGSDDKYTTAFRATWTGEIASSDTAHAVDDTNLLGTITIPVHQAMLSAPVTEVMQEDAGFNIMTWLESELSQVIDLLYEDMILNGDSVGKPTGILLGAAYTAASGKPETVLSGSAGAISYDGYVNAQTALAPQYENENTIWVMNKKSTLAATMKLKDQNNRPLLAMGTVNDGLNARRERVILGDPVIVSQFMPDVGANNFPVLYGDLQGYYLVNRLGFSIKVLDQIQALRGNIVLRGRLRFGGQPVEHWRLKLMKSNNS